EDQTRLLHRSQVRLLRFWEARNVRRRGCEVMGVDIVLQDSQATMMPVTVNVNRLAAHRPNLKAGSIYSLTGFDLTRCNQNYGLLDTSMLIRFSNQTSFDDVPEPSILIGTEYIEAILIPVGGMSHARLDVVWDPLNEVGLEKLWLVVVTMRSMLDSVKTNKEKANKKKKDKKEESLMNYIVNLLDRRCLYLSCWNDV
ncbi:unnamed protein product, partial [Brassica rapa subsp. narinosa]